MSLKINNYVADGSTSNKEDHSSKENDRSSLRNVIATTTIMSGEDQSVEEANDKIQSMFNNLNQKMSQLNEQRKQIEEEIRKGVRASTTSLLSSNTDSSKQADNSGSFGEELITVQDYQSALESRLPTETLPTKRGNTPPAKEALGKIHHASTFSKTQNIKSILRGINDCLSGAEKSDNNMTIESISMTNSIFQAIDAHTVESTNNKSHLLRIIEKQ